MGIGGSGMSGIAEVLLNLGYKVSGSDMKMTAVTERLKKIGGSIICGHRAENISGAEVVVYSSAVKWDNPEIVEAHRQRIPVVPRAEMLAELMRLKYGIAVGGTHGKTTTTSLIASVIAAGGLDPTVVIGGRLNSLGAGAKLGTGKFMIVEADESDGSFLKLSPVIVVVTNIDREHMDHYGEFANLRDSFLDFINKVPFYGLAVLCGDHPVIRGLFPFVMRRFVTYGFSNGNFITGRNLNLNNNISEFDVVADNTTLCRIRLKIPGRHNVQNALAAVSVGMDLDVPVSAIKNALEGFEGIERRFQIRGEKKGIIVVDDYGHHPEEIRATIRVAKECWKKRLILIFQPHRYTRTQDLREEFFTCFDGADYMILSEIYPGGEDPLPGVTSDLIWSGIKDRTKGEYIQDKKLISDAVLKVCMPGDMILTMGAGDIWTVGEEILRRLE